MATTQTVFKNVGFKQVLLLLFAFNLRKYYYFTLAASVANTWLLQALPMTYSFLFLLRQRLTSGSDSKLSNALCNATSTSLWNLFFLAKSS